MTQPVQEWNQDFAEWGRKTAADNASAEYNRSIANNEGERIALDKAKFAWQQQMDRAGLTGKFEDSWTMPNQQWFTEQFGQWMPGGAQAGQQTLTAQQQAYQQAYQNSQAYGQYYAPGSTPTAGQQTLQAQNQANQLGLAQGGLTGYYTDPQGNRVQTLAGQGQQFNQGLQTQQEQRAAQNQQQTQTQAYLQLLSSLRGPADWAKYQQVLGSTPGGMRDLYAAAMGQYVPGGGATTGMAPQPVSLESMQAQIAGQDYTGQGGGQLQQPSMYQYNPAVYGQQPAQGQYAQSQYGQITASPTGMHGTQSPQPTQQQYTQGGMTQGPGSIGGGYTPPQGYSQATYGQQPAQTGGQQMMDQRYRPSGYQATPGQYAETSGQTWGSGLGVGAKQPTPAQQQQATGNGTNMYGNLPAPNQIAAQSWNNMAPSQQQMLYGQYEAQGWDKGDVEALRNQALPKYAGNAPSAGTWRMG